MIHFCRVLASLLSLPLETGAILDESKELQCQKREEGKSVVFLQECNNAPTLNLPLLLRSYIFQMATYQHVRTSQNKSGSFILFKSHTYKWQFEEVARKE